MAIILNTAVLSLSFSFNPLSSSSSSLAFYLILLARGVFKALDSAAAGLGIGIGVLGIAFKITVISFYRITSRVIIVYTVIGEGGIGYKALVAGTFNIIFRLSAVKDYTPLRVFTSYLLSSNLRKGTEDDSSFIPIGSSVISTLSLIFILPIEIIVTAS